MIYRSLCMESQTIRFMRFTNFFQRPPTNLNDHIFFSFPSPFHCFSVPFSPFHRTPIYVFLSLFRHYSLCHPVFFCKLCTFFTYYYSFILHILNKIYGDSSFLSGLLIFLCSNYNLIEA